MGAVHVVQILGPKYGRIVVFTQQLVVVEIAPAKIARLASLPRDSLGLLDPATAALAHTLESHGVPVRGLKTVRPCFEGATAVKPPNDILDTSVAPVPVAQASVHRLQTFLHDAATPVLQQPTNRPLSPLPRPSPGRLAQLVEDFNARIGATVGDDDISVLSSTLQKAPVKRSAGPPAESRPSKAKRKGGNNRGRGRGGARGSAGTASSSRMGEASVEVMSNEQHDDGDDEDDEIHPFESVTDNESEEDDGDFDVSSCVDVLQGLHIAAVTPLQMDLLSGLMSEAKASRLQVDDALPGKGHGTTVFDGSESNEVRNGTELI